MLIACLRLCEVIAAKKKKGGPKASFVESIFGYEPIELSVEDPAFAVFFSQEAVGFRAVGHFHFLRIVIELLADVVGNGS